MKGATFFFQALSEGRPPVSDCDTLWFSLPDTWWLVLWDFPTLSHKAVSLWQLRLILLQHAWFKWTDGESSSAEAWWRADHLKQVCLSRETSKTCRTVGTEEQDWKTPHYDFKGVIYKKSWVSCPDSVLGWQPTCPTVLKASVCDELGARLKNKHFLRTPPLHKNHVRYTC